MVNFDEPTPPGFGTALRFAELPDVLTVVEAARLLRLGRNAVYEAIQRGEIPAVRIGRRLLVPKDRLLATLLADGPSSSLGTRSAS